MTKKEWEDMSGITKESNEWVEKMFKENPDTSNIDLKEFARRCYIGGLSSRELKIRSLEEQIEKMKCCGNCRYIPCSRSSESIKEGRRILHCWNEEKKAYCDIGEGAEYQLWEIKEND